MSKHLGQIMESKALHFLQQQGLKFLTRNYQTKTGEIDLIMRDQTTLVFIEVRLRQNPNYGNALESINYLKQKKLTNTAHYFLQQHPEYQSLPCRFDVIAFSKDNKSPDWIRNAF